MHKGQFVFAQLAQFMNRNHFNYLVRKYESDKYIKSYTYCNQLLTIMFGQFFNRESFQDLIVAMVAHAGKLYHLGVGKSVTRSNLSKTTERRTNRLFEEYATFMIDGARKRRVDKVFELDGHVYTFDSTTIDLCLLVFERAKFRKHKGGIKMHTLYDIESEVTAFVDITAVNVHNFQVMPEIPYEAGAHYIFNRGYNDFGNFYTINRIGAFSLYGQKPMYRSSPRPESGDYRKVSFLMSSEIFRFIKIPKTILKNFRNSSSKTPKTVSDTSPDEQSEGSGRTDFAALPKQMERGTVLQVDQAAPQNQKVLGYIGECDRHPNLLCHNYLLPCSDSTIHETLQILGISLTDKTHLSDLFDKSNFKNVKEPNDSSEPNLFKV